MPKQRKYQIAEVWKRYVIAGLIIFVLAACAPQPGLIPNTGSSPTPEAESSLANTTWVLVSFEESGVETPVTGGSTITLEFDSQGQAGGSGGCNSYSTQYESQENQLSFAVNTSTLMACEQPGIGEQEQRYFRALGSADTFELAGDRMTIWYDNLQGVLNFVAATTITPTVPPTAPSNSTSTAPLTPTAANGSSRERVEIMPGATSATRSGDLPAGGIKEYVLSALAGQTIHVQTVGYNAPVEFTLTSPSGETWSGEPQPSDVYIFTVQVILPQDGDYVVMLSVPPDPGTTHYDVTFTIQP
jgi:heat shock protein HslJ